MKLARLQPASLGDHELLQQPAVVCLLSRPASHCLGRVLTTSLPARLRHGETGRSCLYLHWVSHGGIELAAMRWQLVIVYRRLRSVWAAEGSC